MIPRYHWLWYQKGPIYHPHSRKPLQNPVPVVVVRLGQGRRTIHRTVSSKGVPERPLGTPSKDPFLVQVKITGGGWVWLFDEVGL